MKTRFGRDFSQVRVHTDAKAQESAEALGATAYAAGRHVAFGPGRFAPATGEGRRLLAHELTHVAQQERSGGPSSSAVSEAEAQANGHRVSLGLPARVASTAPQGALQRDEKGKTSGGLSTESGYTKKEKDPGATNKFSYEAFVKLPVLPNGKIGSFSFLESLKITNKGSKESPDPILGSFSGLSSMQTSAALQLLTWKLPTLQLPKSLGELGLETSIASSAALKPNFDKPEESSQELGATAKAEGTYKSGSLLQPRFGSLTLGANLGATGDLKQKYGGKTPGFSPSATLDFGLKSEYLSPKTKRGFATFGGILGNEGQISLEGNAGIESTFEKGAAPVYKPNFGVGLGFTGEKRNGVEPFVKFKVTGEGELDPATGRLKNDSKAGSFFINLGAKF